MEYNINIKKQKEEELINKEVLQDIIKESSLCKHAIRELKLAGYGKDKNTPNDWMYQQVLEAVAVFSSHGNSGGSAPLEINLVQKLCNWDILSPLRFTDDEWNKISGDGTCQNKRKGDVFKMSDGNISYDGAFVKRPLKRYSFDTKEWTENKNPICWNGGLFEYEDDVLTGRYFRDCYLMRYQIRNGWLPRPTATIDCVEVEINQNNWIMAVNALNTDLLVLSCNYNIQWKNCPCMKDVRLEDVTPELEELALEQIRNDK